ncbi:MAG: SprB repeat-containing protein, partial [Caldilineaceae bacterium]
MMNFTFRIKHILVVLILIFSVGNNVYSQTLLHSESFETDGEGTRYTSNTYSYCPTDPDYFFRTNTNPVLPVGCTAGFGNALTNLQGSYFWAGEDIMSNQAPIICNRAPGQITTQNITIAGYTSLQVSLFLATANNNNMRWETTDSINIQASIDGGAYRTVGRFMGNATFGGNLIIDANLNGVIDPAETTICDISNFTKYTFNIPGTGSNINIRIDFDQCGGTEESAIDLIELKGTAAPCSINLTSGVGTNIQNVNIGFPITTITYATTGATGATFTGLPVGVTGSWASNVVTISGSPTTLVGSPFNYTVNLVGCAGSATGTLTVSCPTITVSNPSLATGTQLLPFSKFFSSTNGTAPYSYITASALPTGLTLSTAGLLHGTPAVSGTFPITVTVTDFYGCPGTGSSYNLIISAGTIGVARWVNPSGGTPPAQVVVNCNTYNTAGGAYTTIQSAINAAGNGDVVYITDGTYANASVVANCITGGVSAQNYLNVSGKTNLIITSATGSYCNSAAVITGYGFRIATGSNITIQGLELQNVPVNAFYNSNAGTQTSNVTIKNNYVLGTYGHGIKTDDHPSDGAIDRSVWEITGNKFENIGSYNPGSCPLGPVSAIWLAQAGYHFNIFDNTIINTRWAGILCVGQGGNNNWDFASVGTVLSPGLLTVSGNRIDQTLNAGIQIGFSAGAFYYSNGANITHNKITNANTGNFAGIGGITMLQTNILGVSITYNDVSASNNALAIDITGWQESFDTRTITNNNFYSLTGGHGVTHIAGITPNTLGGLADNLNNYNFRNNYWGAASGPTYSTNPGGTGVGLLKETTLRGTSPTPAGIVYSLNDFIYSPFRTTPVTVNSVVACSMLSLTTTKVDVLCNGNSTGSIDLMVTGGSIPYTYNWNTGQTSQDRSGLAAGTYTVTVTDASCSTSSVSVTITQPAVLAATATPTHVLCNGGNGKVTLTISGGVSPYDISWDGPAANDGTANNQASGYMISSLPAGTYAISVTDENGCIKTASATITEPTVLAATATPTNVLCNGGNVKVTLTITGGTSPYDINWDGPAANDGTANNQASGYMISSLPAGTYAISVTDENGCIKTASATITEPTVLAATATPTNVLCNGGNGKVTLTITGGTSPYDISWDGPAANDGTANNQASGYMISSLPAGTYAISVTDENGCIKTASATITEPVVLAATATPTNVLCNGGSGKVTLTITGGTSPYDISWDGPAANDGTANNQASGYMISSLPAGTYAISVTDENGCIKTASATITEPVVLAATATP